MVKQKWVKRGAEECKEGRRRMMMGDIYRFEYACACVQKKSRGKEHMFRQTRLCIAIEGSYCEIHYKYHNNNVINA